MNALVVIAAGLSVATALPQYYPGLAQYYPAVAPTTTYQYQVVPDAAPPPPNPASYILAAHAPPPVHYQSQYHSQDELGQFSFGHSSPGQTHNAFRDYTGAVRGSYSYIDADGEEVVAHYIADHQGFRVASNALPVFEGEAPVAAEVELEAPVFDLEAPVMTLQQVLDTPEVEAARLEHFRLVEEHKAAVAAALAAASAEEAEAEAETEAPVMEAAVEEEEAVEEQTEAAMEEETEAAVEEETEAAVTELAPAAAAEEGVESRRKRQVYYNALPVEPVVVKVEAEEAAEVTPVVRDAELLRIVHNPGHGTSYRVI